MKCGILITGSLRWDDKKPKRAVWRERRLKMDEEIRVRAPIRYGRMSGSWGETYTMTFRQGDPSGTAILVPCQREIKKIEDLKDEAEELWKAEEAKKTEDVKLEPGKIGKKWGVVGALFGKDLAGESLAPAWTKCFQEYGAHGLSVVGNDGVLKINWPETESAAPAGHGCHSCRRHATRTTRASWTRRDRRCVAPSERRS